MWFILLICAYLLLFRRKYETCGYTSEKKRDLELDVMKIITQLQISNQRIKHNPVLTLSRWNLQQYYGQYWKRILVITCVIVCFLHFISLIILCWWFYRFGFGIKSKALKLIKCYFSEYKPYNFKIYCLKLLSRTCSVT